MLGTLLNPGGRIGPVTFRSAALILIGIGFGIGLLPLLWPSFALSFISIVFLYPWAVIWVKRFHDAGKSGWWFLAVLAPWLIAVSLAGHFIGEQFGPAIIPTAPPAEIFAMAAARMQAVALPTAIASTAISLAVALVVNEELKSQPETNAYGPPEGG